MKPLPVILIAIASAAVGHQVAISQARAHDPVKQAWAMIGAEIRDPKTPGVNTDPRSIDATHAVWSIYGAPNAEWRAAIDVCLTTIRRDVAGACLVVAGVDLMASPVPTLLDPADAVVEAAGEAQP